MLNKFLFLLLGFGFGVAIGSLAHEKDMDNNCNKYNDPKAWFAEIQCADNNTIKKEYKCKHCGDRYD